MGGKDDIEKEKIILKEYDKSSIRSTIMFS